MIYLHFTNRMVFARPLTPPAGHPKVTAARNSIWEVARISHHLTRTAAVARKTFPNTCVAVLAYSARKTTVVTAPRPSMETVLRQVTAGAAWRCRRGTGTTGRGGRARGGSSLGAQRLLHTRRGKVRGIRTRGLLTVGTRGRLHGGRGRLGANGRQRHGRRRNSLTLRHGQVKLDRTPVARVKDG